MDSEKPRPVRHAEIALWVWTVWICAFGAYDAVQSLPEIEPIMASQLQGLATIDHTTLLESVIAGYAFLALTSVWVIWRIGAGKNWARASVLVGFILEAVWCAVPPYGGYRAFFLAIPDFGLQAYALYLLYTEPGASWFNQKHEH
ncbi:MAG: hypothetical protein M3N08_09270 [Pseudomonadota bacterium]|nr:hypothetical protein [Pseudomonadota bacterium]